MAAIGRRQREESSGVWNRTIRPDRAVKAQTQYVVSNVQASCRIMSFFVADC